MQHTVRLHCIILLLAHNTSCFIIIKENKYILTLFFSCIEQLISEIYQLLKIQYELA